MVLLPDAPPAHLDASALGSKEYWDSAYTLELANHSHDPTDEGVIWFSDSGAEEKILGFLETLPFPHTLHTNGGQGREGGELEGSGNEEESENERDNIGDEDIRILDLGTGNGHLLFALQDEGWQAEMVGVDYSMQSVEFARRIQRTRVSEAAAAGGGDASREISFGQADILEDVSGERWVGDGFDIVLDKGTFDAISLNHDIGEDGKKGFEKYGGRVEGLVKRGGYLLVTSCNWTEEEVKRWFESEELEFYKRIRYPSFTFGGVKGQTVSSVCFRRRMIS